MISKFPIHLIKLDFIGVIPVRMPLRLMQVYQSGWWVTGGSCIRGLCRNERSVVLFDSVTSIFFLFTIRLLFENNIKNRYLHTNTDIPAHTRIIIYYY